MSEHWAYQVPDYYTSKWYREGTPVYGDDEDWPRIGIYCPHEPQPFLIGSLAVSSRVLEETGEVYWAIENTYRDGRGFRFKVKGSAAESQTIVDDAPSSLEELNQRVQRALLEQDQAAINAAGTDLDRFHSDTRERLTMSCRTCGESLVLRAQTYQDSLTRAYAGGMREMTLQQLRRVARLT